MGASAEDMDDQLAPDEGQIELEEGQVNYLDIPDDEIDKYFADASAGAASLDGDEDGESGQDQGSADDTAGAADDGDEGDSGAADSDDLDDDESSQDDADDTGDDEDDAGSEEEDEDGDQDDQGEDEGEDEGDSAELLAAAQTAVDQLEKLLSPFKANGREVQVETVDDAITLMQMGANYNRKMAALKPTMKIVKMLQQHDLMDEDKLTQLIDVSKGNPAAIKKLIGDAKIEVDSVEEAGEYSPSDYKVNDSEVELDQVLDTIRENESFPKTIDIVSNQWDSESKGIIFKDPKIITVLDSHVRSGVYDKIAARLESERMLGKLQGVSDIVAYKQIGDAMAAAGLLGSGSQGANPTTPTKKTETTKKAPEKTVDKNRNSRRKAAGPTRESGGKQVDLNQLDPLSMSDEEFEKLSASILV